MRSFSIAAMAAASVFLSVAQADAPKTRVISQTTVTDGQTLDWPNCVEGETPGVEYHRPEGERYVVGGVEVKSNFGSWTFHIQAFSAERHQELSGDDLKQVQLPVTLYCKPNS